MGSDGVQQHVRTASAWAMHLCTAMMSSLCLLMTGNMVHAQSFDLTLTNTPDPILLGSNINYSLSVSNVTGANLNSGVITSEYDTNVAEFVSATNLFGFTNTPGLVVFNVPLNAFPINGVIDVFLELRGTNVGLLTNLFTVEIDDQGQTAPAETNTVSTIALPPGAFDLSVAVLGPSGGVFPGDRFSYQLLAANAGPSNATGVVVSNRLPDNVTLIDWNPTNAVQVLENHLLFSVGALTNQESVTATVSVLATNAADTNLITATISDRWLVDTNPANDRFTTNVPIRLPDTNQIIVLNLSTQMFNQQTGWMEQRVSLTNISTSGVESVRLLVDGLTNELINVTGINVTGTNGGIPYVAHGAALAAGGQLDLLLEYFNPTRTPGGNPVLTAYGTPQLDLTPADGTGVAVERIVQIGDTPLNQGRVLLEWPVTNSASFQVIYDGQANFTSAKGSLPLVTAAAGANRVQWLDYGPPRTLAAPSNTPSRFYKVIELP